MKLSLLSQNLIDKKNVNLIHWLTFGLYSVTEIKRNEINVFLEKYIISSLFCQNWKTGGFSAKERNEVTGWGLVANCP